MKRIRSRSTVITTLPSLPTVKARSRPGPDQRSERKDELDARNRTGHGIVFIGNKGWCTATAPRRVSLARSPALPRDRIPLARDQQITKQRHRRPEPPQTHPHLVDAFGVLHLYGRHVVRDLLEASPADRAKAVRGALAEEIDGRGLCRRCFRSLDQIVATFRVALEGKLRRQRIHEIASHLEQRNFAATLELKLDLIRACERSPLSIRPVSTVIATVRL